MSYPREATRRHPLVLALLLGVGVAGCVVTAPSTRPAPPPPVETPPPPPPRPVIFESQLPGVYEGIHPDWRDRVYLLPNHTFHRGNGDPGTWTFDGRNLVLNWAHWGPATLQAVAPNRFYDASQNFTLVLSTHQLPPPQVHPAFAVVVPGVYEGIHPDWRDRVYLLPNHTFHRGNGDPGSWSYDGQTLTLSWAHWGPAFLRAVAPNRFSDASGRFTLTLISRAVPVAPPVVMPAAVEVPGVYRGVHPNWQDQVVLYPNHLARRNNGRQGTWSWNGEILTLQWAGRGEAHLRHVGPNRFYDASRRFALTLETHNLPAPPMQRPPPMDRPTMNQPPPINRPPPVNRPAPVAEVVGVYQAIHPRWRAELVILPNHTFRGHGQPGTWMFDGHTLLLRWAHGPASHLTRSGPNRYYDASQRLTLIFQRAR